jgi:dihydroorotate dehydrogenase
MGLEFPNPVGLAAGMDKNGAHIDALAALGFGFIEVGTTTPRAQPGNHAPECTGSRGAGADQRLGFNNEGVDALVQNVERSRFARMAASSASTSGRISIRRSSALPRIT